MTERTKLLKEIKAELSLAFSRTILNTASITPSTWLILNVFRETLFEYLDAKIEIEQKK